MRKCDFAHIRTLHKHKGVSNMLLFISEIKQMSLQFHGHVKCATKASEKGLNHKPAFSRVGLSSSASVFIMYWLMTNRSPPSVGNDTIEKAMVPNATNAMRDCKLILIAIGFLTDCLLIVDVLVVVVVVLMTV